MVVLRQVDREVPDDALPVDLRVFRHALDLQHAPLGQPRTHLNPGRLDGCLEARAGVHNDSLLAFPLQGQPQSVSHSLTYHSFPISVPPTP